MEYSIKEQNGKVTVVMSGVFSFNDIQAFKAVLSALDKPKITSCEINLSKLDSIDSSGLGSFLAAHDISVKRGYKISLTEARGTVLKVLETTRMDNLFVIS